MSTLERKSLTPFSRLAKNQCCNFSDIGPRKIKTYCCLEPNESGQQCRLFHNLHCSWFEEAVLPVNADLLRQWKGLFEPEEIGTPSAWVKSARCGCGKLFRSKSNRQTMCDECSEKRRRIKQREYRNKNRENQGGKRAFRAEISQ